MCYWNEIQSGICYLIVLCAIIWCKILLEDVRRNAAAKTDNLSYVYETYSQDNIRITVLDQKG